MRAKFIISTCALFWLSLPLVTEAGPECLLYPISCVNTGQITNQALFQTSIDKMGEKLDALGDKYSKILSDTLDRKIADLDDLSKKRIEDLRVLLENQVKNVDSLADAKLVKLESVLNAATENALTELDGLIKDNLTTAETSANEGYGRLRGGATSFTMELFQGLTIAATFLGIILLVVSTYVVFFWQKQSKKRLVIAGVSSVLICVAIVAAGSLLVKSEAQKQKTVVKEAFQKANSEGDLSLGLRLAARLAEMEMDDPNHELDVLKIEVLRKYFLQPNTFRTNHGRKAFTGNIASVLSKGLRLNGRLDPELSVVLAEVLAVYGESRYAHYASAVLSYRALEALQDKEPFFGLDTKKTATYLLKAYLQFPIADADVSRVVAQDHGLSIDGDLKLPMVKLDDLLVKSRHLGNYPDLTPRHQLNLKVWPAAGFKDTELGVSMKPEVRHGATQVYARV